ncbi:MAG TPA: hypothetical protein EYQ66_07695, partial [Myxococcales bacterium]|nr:hypothetical protein [Myxococcales bacterium]
MAFDVRLSIYSRSADYNIRRGRLTRRIRPNRLSGRSCKSPGGGRRGAGATGAATVRAAVLQFQSPWRLRVFGEIRRPPEAKRVVARTVEDNALVVFSLVERNMVEVMQREAQPS